MTNQSNDQSKQSESQSSKHPYFWNQPHTDTPPLRIAVYQCVSIPQNIDQAVSKLTDLAAALGVNPGQPSAQSNDQSINQAINQRPVDLLVLPELWLSGYDIHKTTIRKNSISLHSKEMQRIQDIAKKYQIALAFGYAERDPNDKSANQSDEFTGILYNSAVTIDSDGSIVHNYRKTHLWQDYEMACFENGPTLTSFKLRKFDQYVFGSLICYDIEFPECARELSLQGVNVLIVHTALGAGDAANIVPMCMVPSRACENHVFLAYSNFCGQRDKRNTVDDEELSPMCGLSGIFAPDGHTIARASPNQTQLLIGEFKPAAFVTHFKHTPYLPARRVELMKLATVQREYDYTPMTRDEIRNKKQEEQVYGDDKFISQIISMENDK